MATTATPAPVVVTPGQPVTLTLNIGGLTVSIVITATMASGSLALTADTTQVSGDSSVADNQLTAPTAPV